MTDVIIRTAHDGDAEVITRLIREHQAEGHLLPRELSEVRSHVQRFVVADSQGQIGGCAELAPLSASTAEVRSLVVKRGFRRGGLAARLVDELQDRATAAGYRQLTAFSHDPKFFIKQNFSIVPHLWLPEKVGKDCQTCARFRQCGQHALVVSLVATARVAWAPTVPRRAAIA